MIVSLRLKAAPVISAEPTVNDLVGHWSKRHVWQYKPASFDDTCLSSPPISHSVFWHPHFEATKPNLPFNALRMRVAHSSPRRGVPSSIHPIARWNAASVIMIERGKALLAILP